MRYTHVVDLTEADKKTTYQNIQSFQNQRKIRESPNRRRRFVDTGDAGPYCVVLRNDERTTGKIVCACVHACMRGCVRMFYCIYYSVLCSMKA